MRRNFFNRTHFDNPKSKKQHGVTTFDFIIWGGLALIIVFGLVTLALKGRSKVSSFSETTELPLVFQGVQNTYNTQADYTGATLDTVARGQVWRPSEVTIPSSGSATVTDQFGGAVTLGVGTITTSNDIAQLNYKNYPSAECANVVNAVGGIVRRVYVDSTNSGTADAGILVKPDGGSINPTSLNSACSGSNLNSITYDIGH